MPPVLDKPLPPIDTKADATATVSRSHTQIAQASKTLQPPRRPVRPGIVKDNTLPKTKQPPVSIRIGPLSQRAPLSGSTLPSSQEEPTAVNTSKTNGVIKKTSTASQQTNVSSASLKSSVSSNASRAKAPIARKNEKRPTAQEEAQKRAAERSAAAEEARKQAHKAAMEKKRQDMLNKDHSQNLVCFAALSLLNV